MRHVGCAGLICPFVFGTPSEDDETKVLAIVFNLITTRELSSRRLPFDEILLEYSHTLSRVDVLPRRGRGDELMSVKMAE